VGRLPFYDDTVSSLALDVSGNIYVSAQWPFLDLWPDSHSVSSLYYRRRAGGYFPFTIYVDHNNIRVNINANTAGVPGSYDLFDGNQVGYILKLGEDGAALANVQFSLQNQLNYSLFPELAVDENSGRLYALGMWAGFSRFQDETHESTRRNSVPTMDIRAWA